MIQKWSLNRKFKPIRFSFVHRILDHLTKDDQRWVIYEIFFQHYQSLWTLEFCECYWIGSLLSKVNIFDVHKRIFLFVQKVTILQEPYWTRIIVEKVHFHWTRMNRQSATSPSTLSDWSRENALTIRKDKRAAWTKSAKKKCREIVQRNSAKTVWPFSLLKLQRSVACLSALNRRNKAKLRKWRVYHGKLWKRTILWFHCSR